MKCANPISLTSPFQKGYVPCGQCIFCRINRRRYKTARLLLEAAHWRNLGLDPLFVTLTVAPGMMDAHGGNTLSTPNKHGDSAMQAYLKRLRVSYPGRKIPAAYVGEYGLENDRAHYHAILFNVPAGKLENHYGQMCTPEDTDHPVVAKWPYGFVQVLPAEPKAMAYICGYVVKKMTSDRTSYQGNYLQGRNPEFFRWSLKPAIGKVFVPRLVDAYERHQEWIDAHDGQLPSTVRIGGKVWPLDRKMREWNVEEWNWRNPAHPLPPPKLPTEDEPDPVHVEALGRLEQHWHNLGVTRTLKRNGAKRKTA